LAFDFVVAWQFSQRKQIVFSLWIKLHAPGLGMLYLINAYLCQILSTFSKIAIFTKLGLFFRTNCSVFKSKCQLLAEKNHNFCPW
jgi:hypothetical protein